MVVFVVRDANGAFVGAVIDLGEFEVTIARRLGADVVAFDVARGGLGQSGAVTFSHESTDCSGPRYMEADRLLPQAVVRGGTAYWPTNPIERRTIRSMESELSPEACAARRGTILPGGFCCLTLQFDCNVAPGATCPVGSVATFDLSTLGFVPLFHVEGP